MKKNNCSILAVVAVLMLTAVAAVNAVPGAILKTNNKSVSGDIRYAGGKYVIKSGNITLEVTEREVYDKYIVAPSGLIAAIQDAETPGKESAAIPKLKQIVDGQKYKMLVWDIAAARALARAYIRLNQPEKALAVCENVMRYDTDAGIRVGAQRQTDQPRWAKSNWKEGRRQPARLLELGLAGEYWEALLKTEKTAKLLPLLAKAIKDGSRDVVAKALVMRGNVLVEAGELDKALKDGYLRVIVLFDTEEAHAEALYRAIDCCIKLNRASYAEKFRDTLQKRHPKSEFTAKLKNL